MADEIMKAGKLFPDDLMSRFWAIGSTSRTPAMA
jgi:hypothetical protein